jgi:hypothetical protein
MRSNQQLFALVIGVAVAGCSDVQPLTTPARMTQDGRLANRGQTDEQFVAIGTSVSMGWASNGVYDGSQRTSWPALMAFRDDKGISLPFIQSPGCTSPIVAPLGAGVRLSGESIAGSSVCAPNDAGVSLPTQNVALAGALAVDAVSTTPQTTTLPWYSRVLPAGTTQLTAALAQHPTIVSVELGANEVLNATSGLVVPGVTVVPLPFFVAPYDALLNALGAANVKVVLAGLPADGRNLPSLRRGDEIWADRTEFAALHVDVSADCDGSPNYVNVSIKSLNAAFEGAFRAAHGLPNAVFSCADIPNTQDLVLTPSDMTMLNGLLGQMTAHIQQQAVARGYAYFSLGALYDDPTLKSAPYSVIAQLTSSNPYGPLISLDGVHPSALGSATIAHAAAVAINVKYHAGAHAVDPADASLATELNASVAAETPLARAKRLVAAHQNEQLSMCPVSGGCKSANPRPMGTKH